DLDRALIAVLVEQPPVELLEHVFELRRAAVLHAHLEQRELALDVVLGRHVDDVDDVDELRELLRDLLDHVVGAGRHEREPRYRVVVGRRDVQARGVVAASRERARDARQRAGLILKQYGNNMAHIAMHAAPATAARPTARQGPECWPRTTAIAMTNPFADTRPVV